MSKAGTQVADLPGPDRGTPARRRLPAFLLPLSRPLSRRCLALVLLPWPGGSGKVVLQGTGRPASGWPDRPVAGLPHQRPYLAG